MLRIRIKRRRSRTRRGRVVDRDYLAWMATQPCIISGKPATVHHVRRFGEPKNDRRTLPLAPEYHMIGFGPHTSIEALGKAEFERRYGIDIEDAILRCNERYKAFTMGVRCACRGRKRLAPHRDFMYD